MLKIACQVVSVRALLVGAGVLLALGCSSEGAGDDAPAERAAGVAGSGTLVPGTGGQGGAGREEADTSAAATATPTIAQSDPDGADEDGSDSSAPSADTVTEPSPPRCRPFCETLQDCCSGDDCPPELRCTGDGYCAIIRCDNDADCGGPATVCAKTPYSQICMGSCDLPSCLMCERDLEGRQYCSKVPFSGSCGGNCGPVVNPGDACQGACENHVRGSHCLEEAVAVTATPESCGCSTDADCANGGRLTAGARCTGAGVCGCRTDAECADSLWGRTCDATGTCGCDADGECSASLTESTGGRAICGGARI